MKIKNISNIDEDRILVLDKLLPHSQNLMGIFNFFVINKELILLKEIVANIVKQDEFTNDVIIPLKDGLVLVYDTT